MMTVAIVVCEGPKMSLYQDLKLKRRKVDSRCSSDGEVVADTNTCSPDSGIATVDECKRSEGTQGSPEPYTTTVPNTDRSSLDSVVQSNQASEVPHSSLGDSSDQEAVSTQNGSSSHLHSHVGDVSRQQQSPQHQTKESKVEECNGNPGYEVEGRKQVFSPQRKPLTTLESALTKPSNGTSVFKPAGGRADNGKANEPQAGNVKHLEYSNYGRTQNNPRMDSEPRSASTPEKNQRCLVITPVPAFQEGCPRVATPRGSVTPSQMPSSHPGGPGQVSMSGQAASRGEFRVGVFDGGGVIVKKEPPDPVSQSSEDGCEKSSGVPFVSDSEGVFGGEGKECTGEQTPHHIGTKSLEHKWMNSRSIGVMQATPTSTVVASEATPGVGPFWNSQPFRINGLRPELISGALITAQNKIVTSPEHKASYNSTCRLRTPSVIMGESGGVRTMVWQPTPQENPYMEKTHVYHEADNAVRASVDGLLSLGQERRLLQATTSPDRRMSHSSPSQVSPSSSTVSVSGSVRSPYQTAVIHDPKSPSSPFSNPRPPSTSLPPSPHSMIPPIHQTTTPSPVARLHPYSNVVPTTTYQRVPLNMEALWATYPGTPTTSQPQPQPHHPQPQTHPDSQALNLTTGWGQKQNTEMPPVVAAIRNADDDDEQPMICMICEDRATGLHYGIITCEGCKGFFKRTVQNKRVYTCVSDGSCEVNKPQRNRCQYCRFQKCLRQGMVIAAVREDRMPGGRNSGAVYNLYKVKYKKHKKNQKNGQLKSVDKPTTKQQQLGIGNPGSNLANGQILKMALTNPREISHLRHRLEGPVTSSSRERVPQHPMQFECAQSMIKALIDCDGFDDIATLRNIDKTLFQQHELSQILREIGDSIVIKLVNWTKKLPFYEEISLEVVTALLTHKWHELLILTTSAYQAIHSDYRWGSTSTAGKEADFTQEMSNNLTTLQTCLMQMMGQQITMDQLRLEVGHMIEKITRVTMKFRKLKLMSEEYVCLKVIVMLAQIPNGPPVLEVIQQRYCLCLKTFVEFMYPNQHDRYENLLTCLPEVQSAAALLLESKMFYVPFLLNSTIHR